MKSIEFLSKNSNLHNFFIDDYEAVSEIMSLFALEIAEEAYEEGVEIIWNSKKSSRVKKVLQFDKNLNLINEFNSPTEASFISNISKQCILACLCKQSKTSGGFIWKYKNN